MSIQQSKTHKIGWTIAPYFIITLSIKDLELLKAIQKFFNGIGTVSIVNEKLARYRVSNRNELLLIIDHFKKYNLQTSKAVNFNLFVQIFNLMGSKVHTNVKGFLELVSLINKLNTPLSSNVLEKLSYLGVIPNLVVKIPVINTQPNLNPYWIAGFITGEGSFTYFTRTRKNSIGNMVKDYVLVIEVSQNSKDLFILNSIKSFFKVGSVYSESRGISKFRLAKKNVILNKLVSYFVNYPLEGRKALQYKIWLQIVNILETEQIRTLERDQRVNQLIKELSNL